MLLLAAVLFLAHFIHLRADFPNFSPWMDWAKYTDEGWYGDAAIRHYQLGHWNVPGDFNPASALPVWPLLEMAVFRMTGVSLLAARTLAVLLFGLTLACSYMLLRLWPNGASAEAGWATSRSLFPALAVLLLSANAFCFVFGRLAIVEPLLVLLMLVSLLVASHAGRASVKPNPVWKQWAWAALLGVVLPLMVLTKTTAIFLFPAVLWMLWAATGYRIKLFFRTGAASIALSVLLWGGYYLSFVRRHFLTDYKYLFSANAYTKVTLATFWSQFSGVVQGVNWLGNPLYGLSLAAAVGAVILLCKARVRSNPLLVVMLLWIAGYSAFMVYHANIQPRYFLVLVVPYTLLVLLVFEPLSQLAWREVKTREPGTSRNVTVLCAQLGAVAVFLVLTVGFVQDVRMTLAFVRHPQYSWIAAANGVRNTVEREAAAHPEHSKLVLSISGSDISLMTGIPSICDDFGTMELIDRVAKYKPGWFATWNDVEDDKMEALAPMYHLERVAAFPAFDDVERNLLILYRLDPLSSPGRGPRRNRRTAGARGRPRQMSPPVPAGH